MSSRKASSSSSVAARRPASTRAVRPPTLPSATGRRFVSPLAAQANLELAAWSRGVLAAAGAVACGAAGVTGWRGFAAYVALQLLAGAGLLMRMRCRPFSFAPGYSAGGTRGPRGSGAKAARAAGSADAEAEAEAEGGAAGPLTLLSFLVSGLGDNAVMFVLIWTFVYAAAHFF